jgi:hypothetical protein
MSRQKCFKKSEIENKDRKKERQNERKGELNNESKKCVLLNKTML